jgi:hypothetical protein
MMQKIVKKYSELDRRNKSGLILSILGIVGWASAIAIIHLFGLIFKQPPEINLTHFVTVPLGLIMITIVANFFEINKKWNINPNLVTSTLTNLHGFWGLCVGLQVHKDYNGYVVLFLFSFGLLFVKNSFGFLATLVFALSHLALALLMIFALGIDIGADEYIFFIFFVLYGASSAFVNELNRRRNLHLKNVLAQRKHGYEQLEKILFPHQITKIASGQSVESTLPIQQGYGCCLTLEVVDSSKIRHELAQEYIREIFRLFSLQLRESYDRDAQICNGYRVIELNNKFVCSVGFPFHCPNNERPSRLSLTMARQFIRTFHENILKMDFHKPIHCSVTITAGELEGFFTRGFPIEYHLHGEPLIKADQINELIKQARKNERLEGTTIVIQDRVFNSLRSPERQDFSPIELSDLLTIQGENSTIQKFYYQQVHYVEAKSQEKECA